MFELLYAAGWDEFFSKLDTSVQQILLKKILKLQHLITARHLKHGVPIFVVEAGQYRICFREKQKTREILFAGSHKQYEKWYKQFE
ncbi:MAG: hypothetical protein V1777_04600 [Candidatus Micrarchaeota archaeon]